MANIKAFQGFTREVQPNGEVKFTVTVQGKDYVQQFMVTPPSIVVFDPVTQNIVQIPTASGYDVSSGSLLLEMNSQDNPV